MAFSAGAQRRAGRVLSCALAGALVVSACANRGGTDGSATPTVAASGATTGTAATEPASSDGVTTAPATEPAGERFGDLPSPCGDGNATIADGQNGGDALVVATPSDRGAVVAPGLTQEMYDAAMAFASWCNEQGGIGGLRIEVLDADGKLFEVPAAMEQVCDHAFAMVGGGWAFDDQQFPRFHECGMIDIAGYTVSTAKAMSDGMAQPLPNPSDAKNVGWFEWAKANYPEAITRTATLYPDIVTTQIVEQQYVEAMQALGGFEILERIPYSAAGEANWALFAQRLNDLDIGLLVFVGSPEQLGPFLQGAREIGYLPQLVLGDANLYAPLSAEGGFADGLVVRSNIVPLEEADRSPAVADYLRLMATYRPDGKLGALGIQAMSAWLLFATGANACLADNGQVLERQCVLEHVRQITGWTGGGLHAPTDPGTNRPSACTMLLTVEGDRFVRRWPELAGPDDDGNGFACDQSWVLTLVGDYGDVNAGRDRTEG